MREIYQNRVGRNSTVLIPFDYWEACRVPDDGTGVYENGFIVLIDPSWYFNTASADTQLAASGLELGINALLLFQRRSDWTAYAPALGHTLPNGKAFKPAVRRLAPIGGTYMARVHSTTSQESGAIVEGYDRTDIRGAGIRIYEYAATWTIEAARLQLEALVWMCHDSLSAIVAAGMTASGAKTRMTTQRAAAHASGLLDLDRLQKARLINGQQQTVCPLCLELISASDFLKRGEQAEGRATWDITVTEVGLFHIEELRVGKLQHKPYNLGWGHHYCNVVVKDAGIIPTLQWMKRVLDNNGNSDEAIEEERRSVEEAVDL